MAAIEQLRSRLSAGLVIPACPLALNAQRKFDERRQRALLRYYLAAGAGGVAVGVHTTQFAIRDPKVGLFKPVLELAANELRRGPVQGTAIAGVRPSSGAATSQRQAAPESSKVHVPSSVSAPEDGRTPAQSLLTSAATRVAVAGICGATKQAAGEATLAREFGYEAGLLSLSALREATDDELVAHCRAIADVIPLFGFYLQPAAGGRILSHSFWRRFSEIQNVVAIKMAPFNRYQTLDVVRAVAEAGREDIALYTGNDDNIVLDLLTPYRVRSGGKTVERRIVGGLLGHWAVWTKKAAELHDECRRVAASGQPIPSELLRRGVEVTDCNAAFFDAANNYAGCIAGLHEVLRRQGLLEGIWCLDPKEALSPGQREEIDRVYRAYPHLADDEFVAANRDEWLRG
jgi:hypothetical protein